MTREEAREALSVLKIYDAQWLREAVDMAIEALQTLEAVERIKTEVLPQTDLVRCKDCMHRHECECPMYHEEWFTIDEGDGYVDDDYNVIDKTVDDGFCQYGERREP